MNMLPLLFSIMGYSWTMYVCGRGGVCGELTNLSSLSMAFRHSLTSSVSSAAFPMASGSLPCARKLLPTLVRKPIHTVRGNNNSYWQRHSIHKLSKTCHTYLYYRGYKNKESHQYIVIVFCRSQLHNFSLIPSPSQSPSFSLASTLQYRAHRHRVNSSFRSMIVV